MTVISGQLTALCVCQVKIRRKDSSLLRLKWGHKPRLATEPLILSTNCSTKMFFKLKKFKVSLILYV